MDQGLTTNNRATTPLRRLVLGTAFATSAFLGGYRGYIRRGYGQCVGGGGTYNCSGALATTQNLTGAPLTVTTNPGFGITAAPGNAFNLTGANGFTFTDTNLSTITGADYGIRGTNYTSGVLAITTTGAVTGTSNIGITAQNNAGAANLTINAADVSGGGYGIVANQLGTGAHAITTTGTVTGTGNTGIFARNFTGSGTDLTINAADVSGGTNGIDARQYGTGALSITTTGTVTGTSGNGIVANNDGTDLTINAADVSGASGIVAFHAGTGALAITTTGTVTGTSGIGISAFTDTDLTINAADVSSGVVGIFARQYGAGALSITATGTVTGALYGGIYARSSFAGTDLTINAVNVSGGGSFDGIRAIHNGSGALAITATGTVTGSNGHGIYARNYSGTDLTINAADVSGSNRGIDAIHSGTGALAITTTGAVTGTNGNGIYARNNAGTDLTINAANVSGADNGIDARQFGAGALAITTTGTVTGTGTGDNGIRAVNNVGATDLTINAVDVSGSYRGIDARHYGTGALSITATGTVTGTSNNGIYAYNDTGTDLTINAVDVSGGGHGISAGQFGAGALAITTSGTVTGTGSHGINARTGAASSGLTINAADVSGNGYGIYASHAGSGALAITTTGTVTGNGGAGILAINDSATPGSTSTVAVESGATVSGTTAGITLASSTGRAASVVNAGAIRNASGATTDTAIAATGSGAVSITNDGTITGIVSLAAGDDAFTERSFNSWHTAGGTNEFGAGANTIDNDGLIVAAEPGAVAPVTTVFQATGGTLTFNANAGGLLEMRNGLVGDVTLIGNSGTGNASFVGNGGRVGVDVALDSLTADRLLISGNASGTTVVNVVNTGGAGAETGSGNTDGISIIQVGGNSTTGAFQLQGGYAAVGPYQYYLIPFDPTASAAGEADPLLGTTTFWDYRLQSVVDASGNPIPVPQVAGYQALPTGGLRYGSSLLNSLHKRLGEIRHVASVKSKNGDKEQNAETFLRGQGFHSDFSGDRGPDFDQNIWFVQLGGNFVGRNIGEPDATLRGGGALSYGGSRLDVKGSSAKVDLNGPTLALTTSYQAARGWYLDAVTQGTRYFTEVKTRERGKTGDPKGWGWGLSLEGGYPFEVSDKLILEPQVQLAYQRIWFDRFTDVDGIAVDLKSGDSLRGRLGGRVQKTYETLDQQWSPFVEINVIREFLTGGRIKASGVGFGADTGGTSLQFGGGLNAQLGRNAAIFTSLNYEQGVTNGTANTWGGTVGVRVNW